MLVKELIEMLKELPSNHRVVVSGHIAGFSDISELEVIPLRLDAFHETPIADHDLCRDGEKPDEYAVYIF